MSGPLPTPVGDMFVPIHSGGGGDGGPMDALMAMTARTERLMANLTERAALDAAETELQYVPRELGRGRGRLAVALRAL